MLALRSPSAESPRFADRKDGFELRSNQGGNGGAGLRFRPGLAVFLAMMLGSISPAGADVLVSNFAEPERAATPMGNNPNPVPPPDMGPWYWAAQSFTTDSMPYGLDSIEVIAGEASDTPPPEIFAALYTDNLGAIGTLIDNLGVATNLIGAHSARAFTPFNPITLDPDTTYWFVLGVYAPGDGTYFWYYADSQLFSGPGSIGAFADSDTSGSVWNYNNVRPYFIQVNVSTTLDSDGDGVDDPTDVCCNTPPGTAVDAAGRPIGDLDLDCDNDLDDFAIFSGGVTGPLSDPTQCP